jgi:hypothetical protein
MAPKSHRRATVARAHVRALFGDVAGRATPQAEDVGEYRALLDRRLLPAFRRRPWRQLERLVYASGTQPKAGPPRPPEATPHAHANNHGGRGRRGLDPVESVQDQGRGDLAQGLADTPREAPELAALADALPPATGCWSRSRHGVRCGPRRPQLRRSCCTSTTQPVSDISAQARLASRHARCPDLPHSCLASLRAEYKRLDTSDRGAPLRRTRSKNRRPALAVSHVDVGCRAT